jgi:hypothetical protein
MAVRAERSYGDWNVFFGPAARAKHGELFATMEKLDYVERDAFLKEEALRHMRSDPTAYLSNVVINAMRLWYNYPYADKLQRPHSLVIMAPNSALLVVLLACLYCIIRRRRLIPPELGSLMLMAAMYLACASLLFACDRYLLPVVPILLVTVFFTATNLVNIKLKNDENPAALLGPAGPPPYPGIGDRQTEKNV